MGSDVIAPVPCLCCGNSSQGYLPVCRVPAHQYCSICRGRGHESDHECDHVAQLEARLTAAESALAVERAARARYQEQIAEFDPSYVNRMDERRCFYCHCDLDDVPALMPVKMDGWTRYEIDIADYAKAPHDDGCFWLETWNTRAALAAGALGVGDE